MQLVRVLRGHSVGSFFTNVQIHTGQADAAAARARLIEALRQSAATEGFVEAGSGEPDRTILVGPPGRWIAVYDEATEGQDPKLLDALATTLSRALESDAVSILVHDSDVLELRLFERGKLIDSFNSNPSYFGRVSAKLRAAGRGQADRWKKLLTEGATVEQLRKEWMEERTFADDTLRNTAALIGIDPLRASVGYRYALEEGLDGLEPLRFRQEKRPAGDAPVQGPSKFEIAGYSPKVDLSAGSPLRISGSVRNAGGASKGITVVAWGDALDRELVAVDRVELVVGDPRRAERVTGEFKSSTGQEGRPMRLAEFADLSIPAGFDLSGATSNPVRWVERHHASSVHANIEGRVLVAGEGKICLGFVPLTWKEGQSGYAISLMISPPSRRPLRAAPEVDAALLRQLDPGTTLTVLASSSLDVTSAAAIACELIERWGANFPERGHFDLGVFRSKLGARPQTDRAKAAGFFQSARWKKLKGQLAKEQVVRARRGDDAERITVKSPDGFAFGRTILPRPDEADPMLPTLALSIDLAGRTADEAARIRVLGIELADEFMTRASGIQALVTRWKGGQIHASLDMTPYETACGVGGQCTLMRSWQTRWLRAVGTEVTWLGPQLAARVASSPALAAAAEMTNVGNSLRLTLRRPEDIDQLERSLQEILPGQQDWVAGTNRLYGRG